MKKLLLTTALIACCLNLLLAQSCPPPDIIFNTQAQVDSFQISFPNITEIEGDVAIGFMGDTDITNLDSLNVLTSINGNFVIGHFGIDLIPGGLDCWGNPFLEDITGLSNLTNIGGDLGIFCNISLQNLSGLESLTSIGGSLRIGYAQDDKTGPQYAGNYSLTNIAALESVTSINGDLKIEGNSSLTSLAGLENIDANSIENISIKFNNSLANCEVQSVCDYLSDPVGVVEIYNNATACNNPAEIANACGFQLLCLPFGNYFFTSQAEVDSFQFNYPDCIDLQGVVTIWENDISNVTNLSGLSGINSIGGDLLIMGNEVLGNLTGMNNLQTIGGDMIIGNGWIDVNPSLVSLSGLEGLILVGGDLQINGNGALSTCNVQSICAYLANPNGDVWIQNNASGCDSQQEVEDACDSIQISVLEVYFKNAFTISPNPIESNAVITYTLKESSQVSLKIFDLSGGVIESLVNDFHPQGEQRIEFNITSLQAGIYFCILKTNYGLQTKKIIKL